MQAVMSYLLAIGALVAMGIFVVGTFGANLKYLHARVLLVNLLRTNPYQVERVASTMQGTFFEAVAAALKTGGMMGTRDPVVIAQATRPTYDAVGSAASAKWKMTFTKAKLAGMAGLGALMVPLMADKSPPGLVIALSVLTLSGFVWIWIRKRENDAAIVRARAEVLPEAERALIDGRYVGAPPGAR